MLVLHAVLVLALLMVSIAEQPGPALESQSLAGETSVPIASSSPAPPRSSMLPATPGAGSILFSTERGVGVLDPYGLVTEFGEWEAADAVWDPLHPGHILVNAYTDGPPRLREFRRTDSGWIRIGRWPTGYGQLSEISGDGRWFAHNVFVDGRETWTIRVAGRHGTVRDLATDHLEVVAWTPNGRVLLSGWSPRRLHVWDPFDGDLAAIDPNWGLASELPAEARAPELSVHQLSWSADGRFFAAPAWWTEHGDPAAGVAIGSASTGVFKVIPVGRGDTVPVWSPSRPEVAYVTSWGHVARSGELHTYDAATGEDTLIRRHVPNPWWVAWSPGGDWMLLDDQARGDWLFVSRNGLRAVEHPSLGSFPRWATPGAGIHIIVC
jgi:WD40 repeat protein